MLTYQGLVELSRALAERTVLSVYVHGEVTDPAKRRRWRIELRHALDDIAQWLSTSSHQEREDFAARRALVEARLNQFGASVRAPAWAGFFTSDGEFEAGPLPVAVRTTAVWSTGPCLSPYIRAMKEARPVIVAIVDRRTAHIYRYAGLVAEPVETLRARVRSDDLPHMSRPSRPGFHPGTRGPTAADEAQREVNAATERMLSELVGRLSRYAAGDGWLLIGGIPGVVNATLSLLPSNLRPRASSIPLDVHATRAQVADAAREAASRMRSTEDLQRISQAVASAESDGRGTAGSVDTLRALTEGRVRELFFSETFLRDHAVDAESAVRLALEQHAFVEHVSGDAARALDDAGGVAARLRYPGLVLTS
jgi:Bacterial archaeo-eukaryotic release factor family 10